MASIRKIEGKGGVSYKITVSMGRDAQDKQIRHFKTWKPDKPMTARQMEKEVQRIAYEFEREITLGFQADIRQTFEQYSVYQLYIMEQRGDKPATISNVKMLLSKINKHIGHMKLSDIRPQHLNALYRKLSEPGEAHWQVNAAPVVDFKEVLGGDTQAAFGRKCGLSRSQMTRLMKGESIRADAANRVERALGRKDLFKTTGDGKVMAPKTIRRCHSIICSILGQAEKEMIIPYNPAKRATPPPNRATRPADCLQPEQVQEFLTALESEPIRTRTIITLFLVTGCRRGEIFGLKWNRVDFSTGQIKIDSSLNYLPDRGVYEGETKTSNIRYISLPKEAVALLKKYRAWQAEQRLAMGDQWEDSGYVFTATNGRPSNPLVFNQHLTRFCDRHNLPRIHPHTFRHTCASILLTNGVDVLTVAKMLGHADTSTTLDTYGHAIEEAKRKAAECISDTILRKKQA